MENSAATTVINNKNAILRYLTDACENNSRLTISPVDQNSSPLHSAILKIEPQSKQLILHQLQDENKQFAFQNGQTIDVGCYMPLGAINFRTRLYTLDDSDNALYCQADIPQEIRRTQLRSSYRVSVMQYHSKASLILEEDTELVGTCRDISLGGVQCLLLAKQELLSPEQVIQRCHLTIDELLSLTCTAKVCHVHSSKHKKTVLGLSFLNLDTGQKKIIEPAMHKLERLNISKNLILSAAEKAPSRPSM